MDDNQKKSLELAIKQIDKTFGKGTLIRLGDKVVVPMETMLVVFQKEELLRFMDLKVLVKQHLLYMQLQSVKKLVEFVHLLMRNML